MKITVLVKPNSHKESVEKLPDGSYRVCVRERAIENQANEAVIQALSQHFHVPQSFISLTQGAKGKRKIFEIDLS